MSAMSFRRAVLIATTAGFIASSASPALAGRQTPPPPGRPRDLALTPPRHFTLPNGLHVTLAPTTSVVPKVSVALSISAGSIEETSDEVWLARLTASFLAQGTTTRSAEQVANDAATTGAEIATVVSRDDLQISLDALTDRLDTSLALISDLAQHPTFPPSELERLKGDLSRELAVEMSRAGTRAKQQAMAILFSGHAYGRPYPSSTALQTFTVDRVRAFHRRTFGPARAHLFVVGRFDLATAEAAIRARFSSWTGAPAPHRVEPPAYAAGEKVHLIPRPGAVQSVIQIATRLPAPSHPDNNTLLVANALFGGAFNSRLMTGLREKHGYAYSPYSVVLPALDTSIWAIRADVDTKFTGPSLRVITDDIDALAKVPPPAAELAAAKAYVAGTFAIRASSRAGLLQELRQGALYDLPVDHLATFVRRVVAVTPSDFQRVVTAHLQRDGMVVVVEGDPTAVNSQLKETATPH